MNEQLQKSLLSPLYCTQISLMAVSDYSLGSETVRWVLFVDDKPLILVSTPLLPPELLVPLNLLSTAIYKRTVESHFKTKQDVDVPRILLCSSSPICVAVGDKWPPKAPGSAIFAQEHPSNIFNDPKLHK